MRITSTQNKPYFAGNPATKKLGNSVGKLVAERKNLKPEPGIVGLINYVFKKIQLHLRINKLKDSAQIMGEIVKKNK